MKKIDYSISAAMSLYAISVSASDDIENQEVENQEVEELDNSALEMSDEEFEKLSESDFTENNNEENTEGNDEDDEPEEEINEETEEPTAGGSEDEQIESDGEESDNQPEQEEQKINPQVYEEVYRELFDQPIKASGREFKLKDTRQARSLIEQGADYSKKMHYIKPHLQTIKTLEKEGLLGDVNELNLLIEARHGNKEALKQLMAKAEVDVLDLADNEPDPDYIPSNHMVSQQEVEVEQSLMAIKSSPAYDTTVRIISSELDPSSREVISENPEYIRFLNEDIESGVYNQITDAVQYQRDVGAIPSNVSDIEAYIAVARSLANAQMNNEQQNEQSINQHQQQHQEPQQRQRSTGSDRKRKNAMSSNRSSKVKEPDFDPMKALEMNDDEFMKKFGAKLF